MHCVPASHGGGGGAGPISGAPLARSGCPLAGSTTNECGSTAGEGGSGGQQPRLAVGMELEQRERSHWWSYPSGGPGISGGYVVTTVDARGSTTLVGVKRHGGGRGAVGVDCGVTHLLMDGTTPWWRGYITGVRGVAPRWRAPFVPVVGSRRSVVGRAAVGTSHIRPRTVAVMCGELVITAWGDDRRVGHMRSRTTVDDKLVVLVWGDFTGREDGGREMELRQWAVWCYDSDVPRMGAAAVVVLACCNECVQQVLYAPCESPH